ncbi:FAD-dependent oxidoreductase [Sinorhizobium medicae]|uniref:FAD-dependent oxidoreductase n=3 Tax=Sinorhizobium medicae TaxID=110321 RepID=A0A6G1WMX3_9HYPH|nr:FAD-binding oxidoreductase [Sinorhizobium medicae]MDX0407561.1 FAD-dependent oxidoreductase [Sinorhizobium medicae]MDX0413326.1 FAD-dependent oxidoreductase [Sinorhizobium medicae]MDX0419491.1 FAD-dependent oxidoreductase [Sinorhizobium medicae]MDX0429843.1 FAD-dependent oxidoreductase [Sinorhizobium medicae]MDX0449783.1 FAD-dependent oxidoreductase [Sinorhizobium medicae]
MRNYDIVIIGGGIAGLSLAYFLSPHRSVAVLEREEAIGYHSTGRSAAEFVLRYNAAEICQLATISKGFFDRPPEGFSDVPLLRQRGGVMIASAEKLQRFEKLLAEERAFTPEIERLTKDEAIARVPILKAEYVAATFYDPNFWDIEVENLLQGYVKGARRNGCEILERQEILGAQHDGPAWLLRTAGGEIGAKIVVNAAGAWADPIATLFGVKPAGIVPHRRTAITVDLPAGVDAANLPEINEIDEDFYMKPEGGRLLASPADATPCEASDVQPEEIDVAWAAHYVEEATTINVQRIAKSWAGLRSFSPDRLPVIGFGAERPDFFWLAGQGGYGILTSPALGALAASLLTDTAPPEGFRADGLDSSVFDPRRFR